MSRWRNWALIVGLLVALGGLLVWNMGGGPVLLILGVLALLTGVLEPVYGTARRTPPGGGSWRATEERFVDPASGELVTVWFDPSTGERRYVAEGQKSPMN